MVDWLHWHNEPLLIATLVLAAWAYALAAGPWRFRLAPSQPFPRAEAIRFYGALFLFFLAVGSPLDQIGERFLFSAHMAQHMVIVYAVAPLALSGLPGWMIDPLLRIGGVAGLSRILTNPVVAAVTYVLCLSAWHVPAAYDQALRVKLVHVVQHLSFFAAALLAWWPLFSRSRLRRRLPPGVQMLYVFALGVLQTPLAAFLTFSRDVLYRTYEFAPRLTALEPLEDQILGGTMMTVGGVFIALALLSRSFYQWYRESAEPDRRVATEMPPP